MARNTAGPGKKVSAYGHTPKPEVHKRVPKDSINVLDYGPLVGKIIVMMTKKYGNMIFGMSEDLGQECFYYLIKAIDNYDPEKGTFITLAFVRLYSRIDRIIQREVKRRSVEILYSAKTKEDKESMYSKMKFTQGNGTSWEDEQEGSYVDFDSLASKFLGTENHTAFLSIVDEWHPNKCLKEFGLPLEEIQEKQRIVLEEMREWVSVWAGGILNRPVTL